MTLQDIQSSNLSSAKACLASFGVLLRDIIDQMYFVSQKQEPKAMLF